jgi:hypothetical protein
MKRTGLYPNRRTQRYEGYGTEEEKKGERETENGGLCPMEFKVEFEAWTFFGYIFHEATRPLDTFYTKG